MSFNCDIIIEWKATPGELTALGNALWGWCSRSAGHAGIYGLLNNQALADLITGKLPNADDQRPDLRGVHFRIGDYASRNIREAIESLRQELPTEGVGDILVDGISWSGDGAPPAASATGDGSAPKKTALAPTCSHDPWEFAEQSTRPER